MKIFMFSSTHWDREWYMPFEAFRMRLVDMFNKMLYILENDENFGTFHFDGQTVFLEDYLEIYPENRGRVEALIKSGKLVVGPWYVLSDELLLSGESFIKNLREGFSVARKFGAEPMKFGFFCDTFGHIAQMPQILNKFGINHALLGRGANDHTTPMHFNWEAPNGDRVTTFKLQDLAGYSAYQIKVMRPLEGKDYTDEDIKNNIKSYIDYEIERSNIPVLLLTDGDDHADCRADTKRHLDMVRELYPEAEVYHSHISEFCDSVSEYEHELQLKKGELIEPTKQVTDYSNLLINTLSSRYPIKAANDKMQTKLEKVIEPLSTFNVFGEKGDRFIKKANDYLIKNSNHDSICGCSIDKTYVAVMARFSNCEDITNQLLNEFWYDGCVKNSNESLEFSIFNPLPYKTTQTVEVELLFPLDWKTKYKEYFNYEEINSFKIFDKSGKEIPYGIAKIFKNSCRRYYNLNFDFYDVYTVSITVDLDASSLNRFKVDTCDQRVRYFDVMSGDENFAENEFIKLTFDDKGNINIFDKKTNRQYNGLLQSVDDQEIGDGWNHSSTTVNRAYTSTLKSISLKERSISRVVFEVVQGITLPIDLPETIHGYKPNPVTDELIIKHTVSLGSKDNFVRVNTTVENNIKDHRLRIKLPTGIDTDEYFVNQPFCFVTRKTGLNPETHNWKEKDLIEKQTSGIVYLKDKDGGIAFISAYGLHECGVDKAANMYITLFRAFSRTFLTDGEETGQLQGKLDFEYIIMPTNNDTVFADLQRRQDFLQTEGITANHINNKSQLNDTAFTLSGKNIVFSTATKMGDYKEIRVYNCSDEVSDGKISFNFEIKELCSVDFDNNVIKPLSLKENTVSFKLNNWEILTLRYK